MTQWLTGVAVCGCLLLMAGCDARQWPLADKQSGRVQNPSKTSSSSASAAPSSTPAMNAAAARRAPSNRDTKIVAAVAAPPQVGDTTIDLAGLREEELIDLLGAPTATESKPPAKIWRYNAAKCHLNVSFYPDVQTRVFRILSYEVTGNDSTDQGKRQCWSELRSRAKPK
ncbi:hypothetical protein [uncultured Ferrovibrio sp.]|uniref:hypothetical protein n=1 Tax=uncultured Ferrovibrio sp. TaxID=1576913 RepID=UPI002611CF32|nr:hypothetical protein [uncultured Ferrovibrio sp.]